MAEGSLIESTGLRSRIEQLPFGRWLSRALDVPNPFYHGNSPARQVLDELFREVFNRKPDAIVVNIGSRSEHQRRSIINLDIINTGNADVLADATHMPFADNSLDLIISIAVVEHTRDPHKIAAETHRVLKPGGRIFCAVPFFQMYHPDPIDMQRYTVTGVANLFSNMRLLERGVELGPASAVSLTLREFFAILFSFNSTLLYNIGQVVFGYLTLPLKYLDHFLTRNRFAFMIACSVYVVAEKPVED